MSEFSCAIMGKHLRDARKRLKLKQADVASMTYISLPYYGKLERGELCPSIDRLASICKVLQVSLPDVFKEAMPPEEMTYHFMQNGIGFEEFFDYVNRKVSNKTKTVMIEVCRQIAMLDE